VSSAATYASVADAESAVSLWQRAGISCPNPTTSFNGQDFTATLSEVYGEPMPGCDRAIVAWWDEYGDGQPDEHRVTYVCQRGRSAASLEYVVRNRDRTEADRQRAGNLFFALSSKLATNLP
jgi:hypothetical protein